ncbi:MAG: tRNA (adenosine(37)-N6)-dimethylallyltransferase MiaA [Ktedonobacterales bacterium]
MGDELGAVTTPQIPLLVLVGPTATGKTKLGVALAEHLPVHAAGWRMEAVSADSRQIYRWMDIATAKPSIADQERLPHHLLDVVKPDESYTLAQYQADATTAVADIWSRGRLPLLVGGTGLYIRAVVDGLAIPPVAPDPELRTELEAIAAGQGTAVLYRRLSQLDPVTAQHIDANNPRRIIRALEVCLITGRPISEQQGRRPTPYQPLMLGLGMERAALYRQADERIDTMLRSGLVEETRQLLARGYRWEQPAMSSLGYREIGAYLRQEMSLPAAVERFKLSTHAYIRRQLTWFRPDSRIIWLDAGEPLETLVHRAAALVLPWLSTWSSGGSASALPGS